MRIQNHLVPFLFLVSLTINANAQTASTVFPEQPFTQLQLCRSFYKATVAPDSDDLAAADTYCSSNPQRIMSIANYCAGRASLGIESQSTCIARQNERAAATIASTQAAIVQAGQQQQQAQAAAAREAAARAASAGGTGTGTGSGSATGTGTGTGAAASGGGWNAQNTVQLLSAVAPMLDESGRAPAAATTTTSTGGTANTGTPSGGASPIPSVTGGASAVNDAINRANQSLNGGGETGSPAAQITAPANVPATGDAAVDAAAAAARVPEAIRENAHEALHVTRSSENATPPPTDGITTAAQRTDVPLTELQTRAQNAGQSVTPGVPACFSTSGAQLSTFATKMRAYLASKRTCTSMAEKAEFLCVEQSSPGARAVRTILNLSGPVIAMVNSAQRSCSSTSNVMDFASKLLTVAKGLCVAAKIACDTSCTNAAKLLTELRTMETTLRTAAQGDLSGCTTAAAADLSGNTGQELGRDKPLVEAVLQHSQAALQNETNAANQGTTPALVQKCEAKMVDIAAFAGNILGMVTARNAAEDCEQQLASDGTTGSDVSVAQYCEQEGNSATTFCKCQRNSQQEGCPGYAVGSLNAGENTGENGTNIRNTPGLSNFAGGANGVKPPGLGSISGSDDGSGSDGSWMNGSSGSGSGGSGALPMVGGGGSGAGGATAATAEAKEKAEDKDKDKKKWDFGSFASSVGSALGIKSNSKGNGSLSAPKAEAIQRKVASDKLAGEISSASGKSNWEKVREQYLIKSNTLILGQ